MSYVEFKSKYVFDVELIYQQNIILDDDDI